MPRVSPDPFPPRRPRHRPDLVDEDPRTTLARVIRGQEERNSEHRTDLAEARNALARLQRLSLGGSPEMARLTVEVAPRLIQDLLATTSGPVRNCVISPGVGAALDDDMVAFGKQVISAGREQRGIYDASVLDDPRALDEINAWAAAGEVQRVSPSVGSEFAVYGDAAVVSVETWGAPDSDYVVLRDPMLIAAFSTLFDLAWEASYPFPSARAASAGDDDGPLLELLARGLKDEAIARYLGWSLRTVRRRVARLMEHLGARTRFQLGAEAVRLGRLPSAGPTAYPGQLGPGSRSR